MVRINASEYTILLTLKSNPFMPVSELAEKLGISRITAKKRLDALTAAGVLRNPIALYNPYALGLERINVIAEVETYDKLLKLEKACDIYPYTHYRARTVSSGFGLFIQFDIPLDTSAFIENFFRKLQQNALIQSFELFTSRRCNVEIFPEIQKYNINEDSWDFSWEDWFQVLSSLICQMPTPKEVNKDFSNFQARHFDILRALTEDATLKQAGLVEKFNLSKTEAHRQYTYVIEKYISNMRLLYNREILGLTDTYLVVAKAVPEKVQAQLYYAIVANRPPFHLSLDIQTNNRIILWFNIPSNQMTHVLYPLWKVLPKSSCYILNTKENGSAMYWFYPNNFDFERHEWKTSQIYMLDAPLDQVLEKF